MANPLTTPPILGYYRYRDRGRPYYHQNVIVHPDNPTAYGAPERQSVSVETWDRVEFFFDSLPREHKKGTRNVTSAFHGVFDSRGARGVSSGITDEGHPYHFVESKRLALRWPETGPSLAPSVPDSLRLDLNLQAFNYFSDVFPEQLSFSEFLFGLRQLKDLLPEIGDSISKTISNGLLTKEFGWDNLLSDLDSLRLLFQNVEKRLAYLRRIRGRGTRMRFHRRIGRSDLDCSRFVHQEQTGDGGYAFNEFRTEIEPLDAFADYSASCWLHETLEFIDGIVGTIRAMTGAFGLNNPIKAIWVNLPFSFVVDWFLHIDRHLDHLTRLNPVGGWDLQCITNTTTVEFKYQAREHHVWHAWPEGFGPWNKIHAVMYDRRVGLPTPLLSLIPEGLSSNQLTLLLAMLHANSA
jgi:hypothetical protein